MKILMINDYGTPTAGAERLMRELRDEMRSRGHTVRIFTSNAALIAGESIADDMCFGTNSRVQTLSSTINPSAARVLRRVLKEFAPDVVHIHMFLWQLSPSILPLLRDVPTVYYAMTYKAVCPTGLKWLPNGAMCEQAAGVACLSNDCITALGFAPLMLQRALWRSRRQHVRTVVSCSHAVKNMLECDAITVDRVIWPGTPAAERRKPLSGPPTITFSGRLVREKGVDVLLKAFELVRREVGDARLCIAGAGPLDAAGHTAYSHTEYAPSPSANGVNWMGQLDDASLNAMLSESWVHAAPSRWPEPFGLTASEAMMRGIAVVASRAGGLAEIVEHGVSGRLVEPGDVTDLANGLLEVLRHREVAEAMGLAARERAKQHFTISRCADQFEDVYERMRMERVA